MIDRVGGDTLAVVGRETLSKRFEGAPGALKSLFRSGGPRGAERGPGPRVIELLLAVLLAALAARFFWLVFSPLPLPSGAPIERSGAQQAAAPVIVKNPFGAAANVEIAEVDEAPDVAETTLNLKLTGVWAEGVEGSAIIALPDGKQRRFNVGDEIINGVELDAVYADQVTIRRNGVREALKFEGKEATAAANQAARRSSRSQPNLRNVSGTPPAAPSAGMNGIASVLRVAPSIDENGERSIELYASRNRVAFESFGLKDGDRLVAINGSAPPTNPAALSSVIATLQRRSSVTVTVERNGERIPISISMDNLRN